MHPKVNLKLIRNFAEIVDDSILFFKQNLKPLIRSYFSICGFFWVAGLVIAVFNQTQMAKMQAAGESIFSFTYFLTLFFSFLNFTFLSLTALSFISLYHEKGNEAPTATEVWSYVKYYLLRVFGSNVVLTVLLAVGIVCCVLPGIYFMPISLLIITIMVLENASLGYSFRQAFKLITENWWNTFGIMIVMSVVVLAAMVLLLIPVGIIAAITLAFTHLNTREAVLIAITLSASALQFLYVLPVIAMALVYYNLNERIDDNSILQRIAMFGKHERHNNQLSDEEY